MQEEQLEQAWATQWAASLAFQREIDAIAEGCEAIGRAFQVCLLLRCVSGMGFSTKMLFNTLLGAD